MQNISIIGLGNELRRDDGVGIWVARRVAAADWHGVTVVALNNGDSTAILAALQDAHVAYVIDAASAAAKPGTIVRFDPMRRPLTLYARTFSSHGLGLAEAIELGRALGMLPERLIVYGIVGADFSPGEGLSPEVERAARRLISRLRRLMPD